MLYFLPKQQGSDPANLDRAGLAVLRRSDDQSPQFTDLTNPGPGGQTGQLVTWPGVDAPLYLPVTQTWHQARGADYWYGWNQKPTPASLLRSRPIPGEELRLGNGQFWTFPSIQSLPCVIDLDDTGRPVKKPGKRAQPFADQAAEALQAALEFARDKKPVWDWQRQFEFLCDALAVNYRVSRDVVARLGLLQDDELFALIAHVTDFEQVHQVFFDLEKKVSASAPSGSPPSGGPADFAPPTTSPA